MWDEAKQQQLNELRRRELESSLTDEEKCTLEQLLYELEQEEWERVRPALGRLRAEQAELQVGVMPDAYGPGKPDMFMAKSLI